MSDPIQEAYEEVYQSTFKELEFYRQSSQRLLKEVFDLRKQVRALETMLKSHTDTKDLERLAQYERGSV